MADPQGKEIVLVTRIYPRVEENLNKLAKKGLISCQPLYQLFDAIPETQLGAEHLANSAAAICRPIDGKARQVRPEHIPLGRDYVVGTLSTSVAELSDLTRMPGGRVRIVHSNSGNARGPAELAIIHILSLLRRVLNGHDAICSGEFEVQTIQLGTRLEGKKCFLFGAGRMVQEMIDLLVTLRVDDVFIWHDNWDGSFDRSKGSHQVTADGAPVQQSLVREKMRRFLSRSNQQWVFEDNHSAVVRLANESGIRLIPISTFDDLPKCDVVSVHLGSIADKVDELGRHRRGTGGLINAEVVKMFRRGAVFINVGRGEVISPEAEELLVQRLREGTIGGVGFDVLQPQAEGSHNSLLSPFGELAASRALLRSRQQILKHSSSDEDRRLLAASIDSHEFAEGVTIGHLVARYDNVDLANLNIIGTPHIGAWTDIEFEYVTAEVVVGVLSALHIPTSEFGDLLDIVNKRQGTPNQ